MDNNNQFKQEVIRRMKKLKLWDEIIQKYQEEGTIFKSEFHGNIYTLTEKETELVKKFEESLEEYGAHVYHVIKDNTAEGPVYLYLYVTNEDTEEHYKNLFDQNLKSNIAFIYLDAADTQWFSEHGTEYLEPMFGGLRIAKVRSQENLEKMQDFD